MHLFRRAPDAESIDAVYRIASRTLTADSLLPALAPFQVHTDERLDIHLHSPAHSGSRRHGLLFEGDAWIGGAVRLVRCWADGSDYLLQIDGIGRFWVAAGGKLLGCLEQSDTSDAQALEEALLGPAMMLALALQEVWCLHASAVQWRDGVIAFLGDSGTGKSTLARFLASGAGSGFTAAADDILPIEWHEGGAWALPHFPQLKLPPHRQPLIGLPERLPLSVVCLLDTRQRPDASVSLERLRPQAATLALVRHTVAARLFAPGLLLRHLDFTSAVATCVPIFRLAYPKRFDALPLVGELLSSDLRTRTSSSAFPANLPPNL